MEPPHNASTVYVVDDEADYRLLVQQVFSRFLPHYALTLFAGGDALLQHLRANTVYPGLILLDLRMPDMNGHQTLMRLKQESTWRSIPVVIVTSSPLEGEIRACYQSGVNSCLVKPIGLEPMRQRLTLICDYWLTN